MLKFLMSLFRRLSLNTRVWIVLAVVVIGLTVLSGVSLLQGRTQQMHMLTQSLHKQVDAAQSIAASYQALVEKGELPEAEARQRAFTAINAMRWDSGTGYVFAFDSQLIMRLHPLRAAQIGKSIADDADAHGFHHYQAMLAGDRKDGTSLITYTQTLPGVAKTRDKISVSQWYKPWDLHLVSGAYFNDIDAQFYRQMRSSLELAGAVAAMVLLVVWASMRSIRATLGGEPQEAIDMAANIASGDLRQHGEAVYAVDSLLGKLDVMRTQLAVIVGNVQRGAVVVATASRELTASSDNLSQRTQEQAASLEESAASMEEMTSTVMQNAQNATEANRLSRDARQQAEQGGAVAARAMAAMTDISASSNRIGDIVGLIENIAFQTNLLALNAAVEAARAGDHGRGFAVVATEVRRLSQSSAAASKDIKLLISETTERVQSGRELVSESATSLNGIVGSVARVTDIVAEVAAASKEQSTGVDQVNVAMAQIDEVTQQNAALVEEAAAVAKVMEQEADALHQAVAAFKLDAELA